jgi:AraC family transcriptional regulator
MAEPKMQADFTPRIEHEDAMLIAGSQRHYTKQNLSELSAQWERLPFGNIPGQTGRAAYGVIFDGKENECDFEYLTGVEVTSFDNLPADFARMSIPAHRYAKFTHVGNVSKLKETIDAVARNWLSKAKDMVGTPAKGQPWMIEFYGEDFNAKSGTGTIEIWFPVKQ